MLKNYILNWGWFCGFILLTAIVTERALKHVNELDTQLDIQLSSLIKEREEAIKLREQLQQQINSQSDPEWIELVLKRELGLVPEGQIKVLFVDGILPNP